MTSARVASLPGLGCSCASLSRFLIGRLEGSPLTRAQLCVTVNNQDQSVCGWRSERMAGGGLTVPQNVSPLDMRDFPAQSFTCCSRAPGAPCRIQRQVKLVPASPR